MKKERKTKRRYYSFLDYDNHTYHEATEAHNYVYRRLGEIERDLKENV